MHKIVFTVPWNGDETSDPSMEQLKE